MKKFLIFLLFGVFSCNNHPSIKCLQIDYSDSTGIHTTYLNVIEESPLNFQVLSQENLEPTPFIIHRIFDYDSIDYE